MSFKRKGREDRKGSSEDTIRKEISIVPFASLAAFAVHFLRVGTSLLGAVNISTATVPKVWFPRTDVRFTRRYLDSFRRACYNRNAAERP